MYVGEEIKQQIFDAKGNLKAVKIYIQGPFLGKGGFARVYSIQEVKTEEIFAAKQVRKSNLEKRNSQKKLMQEIRVHENLNHPHVVKFKKYFHDDNFVYLLLELCKNTSLSQLMKNRKKLSELETKYYTRQIIKGLVYLHQNQIIHRDLKLGNIFLDDKM